MQHPVTTASLSDSAVYAARLMREHHIGLVPLVDDAGRLAGMLTERDLISAIAVGSPLDVKLSKIARPAVSCGLRDALELAEQKMIDAGSHYVVICDDEGRPRGVIGVMDLARYEDARRAALVLFRIAGKEVRS